LGLECFGLPTKVVSGGAVVGLDLIQVSQILDFRGTTGMRLGKLGKHGFRRRYLHLVVGNRELAISENVFRHLNTSEAASSGGP
jgi:hypothetical protein